MASFKTGIHLAILAIVGNRITFKSLTIIFGIVIALVIFFSLWMGNPEQIPVATERPVNGLTWIFNAKEMGRMVLQSIL